MRHFELPFDELTRLLLKMMDAKPPFILVLDRTQWKIRSQAVNVLVLCLWRDGVCRPLLWHVLAKAGSTSHRERVALLSEFDGVIGFEKVKYLIGNREFHGKQFYQYLHEQNLKFRLRVRHDTAFTGSCGPVVRGREMVRGLAIGVPVRFRHRRLLWGTKLWVWAKRLSEEETLMVVAPACQKKSHLFVEYGERWRIEELFESVKSRGFGLEATRISQSERLRRLIAVVAIGFIWAVCLGAVLVKQNATRGNRKSRRRRSIFRVGLDELTHICTHLAESWAQTKFIKAVRLLCRNTKQIMRL